MSLIPGPWSSLFAKMSFINSGGRPCLDFVHLGTGWIFLWCIDNRAIFNQEFIKCCTVLKHLGFIWDTEKSNLATLNHININERTSQFQAVAHTLVRAGIRFSHPNTIIQLYNSLVIPKLTYGLEICNINQTLLNKLDVTGRNILKSFFNISKYSRNYLHSFYNIDHISVILTWSKLNLFVRLMNNPSTSNIILSQLEHGIKRDTFVSN